MAGFVRSIAERAATDIRHYSSPGRGGHFLAFEEPAPSPTSSSVYALRRRRRRRGDAASPWTDSSPPGQSER